MRPSLALNLRIALAIAIAVLPAAASDSKNPCPLDLNDRYAHQINPLLPWDTDTLGRQWAQRPKYFIVIGVTQIATRPSDKTDSKPDDFALVDIENVVKELCELGYGPAPGSPNGAVLGGANATRDKILTALEGTSQIGSDNPLLILYFSGHGIPNSGPDDLYLPLYDSKSLTITQSQSLRDLLTKLRSNYQGDLIVVLDACFSGTATVGNLLTTVSDFTKTAILTSSSLDEYSYPIIIAGSKQSAFTYFFLRALDAGGDVHDGITTLGDAHFSLIQSLANQHDDQKLRPEERLPGTMTPSITATGVPKMIAYSRSQIDNPKSTRRFVYTLIPRMVEAFNLNTARTQELPGELLVFSGSTILAKYTIEVDKEGTRTLVPSEIAQAGTLIDVTNIRVASVPQGVDEFAFGLSNARNLEIDSIVSPENKRVKLDPTALDHSILFYSRKQ